MSSVAKNLRILVGTAALAAASMAFAGDRVDWSVSIGSGGYGYTPPAAVYTSPPAVVYTPPPVVYYRYVTPHLVYPSHYYGPPGGHHHGWKQHHRHHRHGQHNHGGHGFRH